MEDGDSDEGGAGHLLTAWLGELDTLKKVRRISQLRDKEITLTEKILWGKWGSRFHFSFATKTRAN